ncbi:helix-turn-helix domain-containing protein [Streptosporangium canum]|uniref:helix-turn-helix domain-containing protein n=1 Tax=Streptosporangium canum TaxID=324952 RepID=UPI0036AB60C8
MISDVRSARGPRVNGAALKAFRDLQGMNQTALSKATAEVGRRISTSHINRLESGARNWPSLQITSTLATALGVRVGDLLAHERCDEFND